MAVNIKAFIFVLIAMSINITFISSCSFLDDADVVRAPIPEDLVLKRERERREALGNAEDDSFVANIFKDITGFGNKDKSQNSGGIGVNTYLWKATLNTLSFMPLLSADPFGGVIITDWHSSSETSKEKFKIVAYILGKELRVDGIKVSVFKKSKNENGEWIDTKSNKMLQSKVEDAILTKARKYKIQNIE
jgi:hypothetical protein